MIAPKPLLDPFGTSAETRAFIFDSVVLPWEMDAVQIKKARFDRRALHAALGLELNAIKRLADMEEAARRPRTGVEFLTVYIDKGTVAEATFRQLRNTFAHGHFGPGKRAWIRLEQRYQGKLRLLGQLQVTTLRKLIEHLQEARS